MPLDDLWARHVAAPGDLAHRRVLADALIEAGDPRGELIQLQLALDEGPGTAPMEHRANELLTEHRARWSAGLPQLRAQVDFRRGFPARVISGARGVELDRSIDRPEWATVEELEINGTSADLPRLLARMPLLRVLVAPREVITRLAMTDARFPSIRAIGGGGWLPADRLAFPSLAVVMGRWLTYAETATLERAQRTAAELGLDALVHNCLVHVPEHISKVVAVRAQGPAETRCALLSADRGGIEQQGWYVQTWRATQRALVGFRASGWFETQTLRRILEPLAAVGITRIELAIPPVHRARHARELEELRAEMRGRGVEIGEGAPIDIHAPATVGG